MIKKCIKVFIDDFYLCVHSFDTCLNNLDDVLKRCVKTNIVLDWEKFHFMVTKWIILRHKISAIRIKVDKAKAEVIEKLRPPANVKGIRSFPRHTGFYIRFIKDLLKPQNHEATFLIK